MPLMQSSTFNDTTGHIGQAGVAAAFGSFAAALANGDVEIRRTAARYFDAVLHSAQMFAHMGFELDNCVLEIIVDRLVDTGDIDVARPLLGMVRSDDVALRNAVVAALPRLGETLLPELQPLLDDDDHAVRIAALNLAQGVSGERAAELALGAIAIDPHVNVCAAAVDILAETGSPDAIEPLRALALRFPGVPYISFAVAAAIKRIG